MGVGVGVVVAVGVPVGAGVGVGVGVGMGVGPIVIAGGVAYWLGQMEAIIPAGDANGIGGCARLTTPIWLLYRMLLGSPLANIGAWATADIPTAFAPFHNVA